MDKQKLQTLLREKITVLQQLSYEDLCRFINNPQTEKHGEKETFYQVEWESFYDDNKSKKLRVMVCIDNGSWRAFRPLCDDFLITPDN